MLIQFSDIQQFLEFIDNTFQKRSKFWQVANLIVNHELYRCISQRLMI